MSTCTDLINTINAVVVDPSLIASVDPSTIATLTHSAITTETVLQLGAGGAAILSFDGVQSVNGKRFKIIISGRAHQDSGVILGLYVGTSTTVGSNSKLTNAINTTIPSLGLDGNFYAEYTGIWDSITGRLSGAVSYIDQQLNASATQPFLISSLTTQSSLKFVLTGKFSFDETFNTLNITQFEARLA